MASSDDTEVIIVGGGPIGLTTSLYLSHLGVRHTLLERHPGTSLFPRAIGLSQRTMEFFRALGLSEVVSANAAPVACQQRTAWYTSFDGPTPLHGKQLASRDAWGSGVYRAEYAAASRCTYRILAQIRLEPLLREAAERSVFADIRFGVEVTGLAQDDAGVTVQARTGEEQTEIRGQYLVGADAGRTIAPLLGIDAPGPTNLADMVSVYFSADLSKYRDPGILMTWFVNPDLGGSVETGILYPVGPWDDGGHSTEFVFAFARGIDDPAQFDDLAALARLKTTLGIIDFDPVIHRVSHWFVQAVVANRFRSGRCFLAGDAAHRVPPWGGLGMNTGLQDVQNLTWKLGVALNEPTLAGLLDSYEEERRPIAVDVANNALASLQASVGVIDDALDLDPNDAGAGWDHIAVLLHGGPGAQQRRRALDKAVQALDSEFHPHGADCGFFYTQGAFQPADVVEAVASNPVIYTPRCLPGHHLPHFWLPDDGGHARDRSTTDLPELSRFVLLLDRDAGMWRAAADHLGHPFASTLTVFGIDGSATSPDHSVTWEQLREVGANGAILVRPDGIIAARWSRLPADPRSALEDALYGLCKVLKPSASAL